MSAPPRVSPRRGLRSPLVDEPGSLSRRLRDTRFERFLSRVEGLGGPRIVDLGGTVEFWEERAAQGSIANGEVVLVNLQRQSGGPSNVTTIEGDVTSLSELPDMSFDAVFSNSVIEHVGPFEKQAAMAREVRRLAPIYSVQTPNYWFPLEPHFLFPGWQWLPVSLRIALVRALPLGYSRRRSPDVATARRRVESIRLLRLSEIEELFPDGEVSPERIGPLVKSWTVERVPTSRTSDAR